MSSEDGNGVLKFPGPRREGTKSPDIADRIVGARIKQYRILAGMSQDKLAEILGITFQQVQKYEKGINRVGAGRLLSIAKALGVPISIFFEEHDSAESRTSTTLNLQTLLSTREGIALAQAFVRIEDPAIRQALVTMAKAAARKGP